MAAAKKLFTNFNGKMLHVLGFSAVLLKFGSVFCRRVRTVYTLHITYCIPKPKQMMSFVKGPDYVLRVIGLFPCICLHTVFLLPPKKGFGLFFCSGIGRPSVTISNKVLVSVPQVCHRHSLPTRVTRAESQIILSQITSSWDPVPHVVQIIELPHPHGERGSGGRGTVVKKARAFGTGGEERKRR